jgi:hypothetical protein
MIALRGKLERTGDGESESSWKWKGRWAFGTKLLENDKALPFEYSWKRFVDPKTVEVPSAHHHHEEEEKSDESGAEETEPVVPKSKEKLESGAESKQEKDPKSAPEGAESGAKDEEANTAQADELKKDTETEIKDQGVDTPDALSPEKTKANDPPEVTVTISMTTTPSKVTFADQASSDDPPFTDASTKHKDNCPPSGEWSGYFETIGARKGTTIPVKETFCLFLNATPSADARIAFVDDDHPAFDASTQLPDGHIQARGVGENQYGTFELLGHLDLETGMLECQRMYVTTTNSTTSPRSPRSRSSTRSKTSTSGERSYVTRKRQLSWKRRAAMEETDAEAKARRAANPTIGPRSSKKRARIDPIVTVVGTGVVVPTTSVEVTMAPPISITLPPLPLTVTTTATATSATKRPQPSPRLPTGNAPAKKRVSTGSSSGNSNRNSSGGTSSSSGHMKLPAAGNPAHARWRAAHFLYYQRNDPSMEDASNTNSTGTGTSGAGTSSSSAPPRYVVYEGELLNSHREGRGVCLYNNGMMYEGEWKRNKEHGHGILRSDRKRIIYKGEWERGRMHGHGTYYYSSQNSTDRSRKGGGGGKKVPNGGSRYEGDFKENLRHGMGTYVLPDGSVYSGQWREGMMSGRGVFTWPDGAVYDGEWKDGKRHGLGLLKTADVFTYDGMWVQNSMEGRGSATYPNGQQYNGLFSNGRREGRGTILFPNGAVYEGRFRDDAVDGQGTMKMNRTLVVPRTDTDMADEDGDGEEAKDDFMIPLYFQSDIGHIHRKAGFTGVGE